MAPYCMAWRVISRITDSVKCSTLSLRKCFCAAVWDMRLRLAGVFCDCQFPCALMAVAPTTERGPNAPGHVAGATCKQLVELCEYAPRAQSTQPVALTSSGTPFA